MLMDPAVAAWASLPIAKVARRAAIGVLRAARRDHTKAI